MSTNQYTGDTYFEKAIGRILDKGQKKSQNEHNTTQQIHILH
jgi:hypothetical protein